MTNPFTVSKMVRMKDTQHWHSAKWDMAKKMAIGNDTENVLSKTTEA